MSGETPGLFVCWSFEEKTFAKPRYDVQNVDQNRPLCSLCYADGGRGEALLTMLC